MVGELALLFARSSGLYVGWELSPPRPRLKEEVMLDPTGLWDLIPKVEEFLEDNSSIEMCIQVRLVRGKYDPWTATAVVRIVAKDDSVHFDYIGGPASVHQIDMLKTMVVDLYNEIRISHKVS